MRRVAAGALLFIASLAVGAGWSPLPFPLPAEGAGRNVALAQPGNDAHAMSGTVEVRVAARRLADGRTEFALQQRDADGSWGDRRLPRSRFFPARAEVGRWLASSRLTVQLPPEAAAGSPALVVRVAAQLLADKRMEFALQQLEIDGTWSERRLPTGRFFPAGVRVGRWLSSSPLTVTPPVTTLCEGPPQDGSARLPDLPAAGAFIELPSTGVHAVSFRFFESGFELPPREAQVYTDRFDRATARHIRWQLDMRRPARHERTDIAIEVSVYSSDGSLLGRSTTNSYLLEGWTNSSQTGGLPGEGNPPSWQAGIYRVELTVERETIARRTFEVVDRRIPDSRTFPSLYGSLPWVERSSPTYDAQVALLVLLGLREADPEVATSLAAMPWVREGPGAEGLNTLRQLESLTCEHLPLVRKLTALTWLADGVTTDEWVALRTVALIAADSAATAELVADYEWVRDGMTGNERRGLEYLWRLARAALVDDLGAAAWVGEGDLTDHERWTLRALAGIGLILPDVAAPLVDFEWLYDEITRHEHWFMAYLMELAERHPELAPQIVGLPWTHDAIDRYEQRAVQYLLGRADGGGDTTAAVVLLRDLSPADAAATYTLRELSETAPQVFEYILSHPTIIDGITDREAAIVSTLGSVHQRKPEILDTLLDPAQITVAERVIEVPASGEMTLTVISTRPGVAHAIDVLERALRFVDQFMAAPLSHRQVTVLLEDVATPEATATNFGTHIAIRPELSLSDGERWLRLTAHEVSHYYWHGNAWWIDEGIANFIETLVDGSIETLPRRAATFPCSYARSIAELETLDPEWPSDEFDCFYTLGEAFFRDLYHGLGDEFLPGLRRLYHKSLVDDGSDACPGTQLGVCHVEAAFKEGASEEAIATVDMALSFWYGEREPE